MSNRNSLLRSAGYCLSAALLFAVVTPPSLTPAHAQNIVLKSMGGRTFGGINKYNPADPTGSRYLSCDHGVTEWFIPVGPGKHPHVLTHGSGIRGYQTTFDGQPGFQTILLRDKYPVYLVD